MRHLGDITKLNGFDIEPVDVITGGSPCQDLSLAGKRAGLAGERSGLFMEQIRLVKEMRDATRRAGAVSGTGIKPRYMVWENVPGAFSSNGGEDFRAVLEETARVADPDAAVPEPPEGRWQPSGCIVGDGGSIAWRVHDAQYWGVPQRRKRICLVADFGGLSASEVLFERQGMRWNPEQGGETGKGASGAAEEGAGKTISFQERAGKPGGGKGILIQDEHTGALSTLNKQSVCYGIGGYNSEGMKSDNPHSGIYEADTSRTLDLNGGNPGCNQGGMAVVNEPISIGNGQVHDAMSPSVGISKTLNCMGDPAKIITFGIDRAAFNQGQNALYKPQFDEDLSASLIAKGPNAVATCGEGDIYAGTQNKTLRLLRETYGAQAVSKWTTDVMVALQQADLLRQGVHESGIQGKTKDGDKLDDSSLPCPALVAGWVLRDMREREECGCTPQGRKLTEQQHGQPAESMQELPHQAPQTGKDLLDMWQKGERIWLLREALSEVQKIWQSFDDQKKAVYPTYTVRRLTPLEAERLQGYPDGWTDIGEWTDTKGKLHKPSDSARYKALGNSIAVGYANNGSGFWMWLLKRISAQYERNATLGSLFDGIGGFPLAWEHFNGKGSARWASEIEEFPIAVTKLRFGEN